jgi:hypothetical protein
LLRLTADPHDEGFLVMNDDRSPRVHALF